MAPRKKPEQVTNQLLEAVRFISHAQRGKGDEMTTHCMIRYGQIIAFDRSIAAGAPIAEHDLNCCPQTERMQMALERCGVEHTIIQQSDNLFVRSGEFSAYVPFCDPRLLAIAVPDPACAPLGDTFRTALMVTGSLVKDNAPTYLQSTIQLLPFSCISTNGNVIIEAWHGFDMPPGLVIPKSFAEAVCKIKKRIVSFGYSSPTMPGPATFTIHFEDRSWIRCNTIKEKVPAIQGKLVAATTHITMPDDFIKQVAEIAKWSEDGRVYLHDFLISSHSPVLERTGSELSISGAIEFKQEVSYSIASLKAIAKYATHFDDRAKDGVMMFFGTNLRGAIAHEAIERLNENGLTKAQVNYQALLERNRNQLCSCGNGKRLFDCDNCIPF